MLQPAPLRPTCTSCRHQLRAQPVPAGPAVRPAAAVHHEQADAQVRHLGHSRPTRGPAKLAWDSASSPIPALVRARLPSAPPCVQGATRARGRTAVPRAVAAQRSRPLRHVLSGGGTAANGLPAAAGRQHAHQLQQVSWPGGQEGPVSLLSRGGSSWGQEALRGSRQADLFAELE